MILHVAGIDSWMRLEGLTLWVPDYSKTRRTVSKHGQCCEVTSSYATTPLLFEQRGCCLNNAPTKLMEVITRQCVYISFPFSY